VPFGEKSTGRNMRASLITSISIRLCIVLASVSPCSSQSHIDYPNQVDQKFIWNGTTLMPLYSNDSFPCDRWEIWYFKQKDPQIPGTQWGSSDAKSANEALRSQQRAVAFDHQYARFFGAPYPTDSFVHDNFVGPICISEAAFSARPQAIKVLDEIGERAESYAKLIERSREVLAQIEEQKQGQGNSHILKDETPIEEFLHELHEIPERIDHLHSLIMTNTAVPMSQIETALSSLDKDISKIEHSIPEHSAPFRVGMPDDRCLLIAKCNGQNCPANSVEPVCDGSGRYLGDKICAYNSSAGRTECHTELKP
jgi:hypothetical protein